MMNKSKTKIVIASVLKPVDDVRNYEKIANSLTKDDNYEITILGTHSNSQQSNKQIFNKPWTRFKPHSIQRIMVQKSYWRILKELEPNLIICTTFELLLVSVFYRWRFGSKVIYDIQEDYLKNLWHQRFYPIGVRHVLGASIRIVERFLHPWISYYFLAEKIYQKDIRFTQRKSLILENKSLKIPTAENKNKFKVIFTGTITSYSRAIESIELYLMIKNQLPDSILTVIGHVPFPSYKKLLETRYENLPNIDLKLSSSPVSHLAIVEQISTANLGIIGYSPNAINQYKVPTKLYEYITAKLPYLVQKDTIWFEVGTRLGGAISVDLNKIDSMQITTQIANVHKQGFAQSGYLWQEQEESLLSTVHSIFN